MSKTPKVSIFQTICIPDMTPLPMGAPVKFFAPSIDIAIERGVARLKSAIQMAPSCNKWIVFGWIDGGLTSSFVSNPIGAFRLDGNAIVYSTIESEHNELKSYFSFEFDSDWVLASSLCKATLIQGYEEKILKSDTGNLTVAKVVNIDPSK